MPTDDRTAESTFDRVAADLTHEAFTAMGTAMRSRSDSILKRWRGLSVRAMPHLDAWTLDGFENAIAAILSDFAEALQSSDPRRLSGIMESGPQHGIHRFMKKRTLPELFEEVRILRAVILLDLAEEMRRPLYLTEATTFHAIFDVIIQQAVMTLVQEQSQVVQQAQSIMRDINQRFIVTAVEHDELLEQAAKIEEALRQSETSLRASEVRYRRLFEASQDGVLILDARTGKIIDANAFMTGLTGLEHAELLGKELHEIGLFKDAAENQERFRELQRAGHIPCAHLPLHNQRDEVVDVEIVASIYEEDQKLVAQCNVRDISERAAMQSKIAQQAEAIANESRRKDEFLAMLSHELRNPLAPIRSAAHILKLQERGSKNLVQQEAREIIERQVDNLTRIVGDLLEVSRVVTGRIQLDPQVVDMNEVVEHAIQTVTPLIEQRRHEVVLHVATDPVWICVDATRMEEVFVNLLNNAAKYTSKGGRIEVWCENPRGQNYAQVRVRDNGIGIDTKLLPQIFDLFTQSDRSLDRAGGGLGIGLSLAQRLVDLHGGTIEAHSPPKNAATGSEFIVQLPLAPTPEQAPQVPSADETAESPQGRRVLLVDDNVDQVMALTNLLRYQGYSVHSAYNGPDALKVARQWRPDIVLLDIGLPGLDGYQVARHLRSDPSLANAGEPMRLIALTGYGGDTDIALAREAGFDAHMVKPIDLDELEKLMAVNLTGC